MNYDEAIAYLHPIADSATVGHYSEMLNIALSALREQTEREKGCNYCLQTWPDRAAAGVSDIWHGNKLSVGYGVYREIKFCPMCGRELGKRLEVEP